MFNGFEIFCYEVYGSQPLHSNLSHWNPAHVLHPISLRYIVILSSVYACVSQMVVTNLEVLIKMLHGFLIAHICALYIANHINFDSSDQ